MVAPMAVGRALPDVRSSRLRRRRAELLGRRAGGRAVSGHPSPEARAAALRALADELMARYPGVEAIPIEPGQALPPGARILPAAGPMDVETRLDVGELGSRGGRSEDDAVDE